jgi:hypothetical protein
MRKKRRTGTDSGRTNATKTVSDVIRVMRVIYTSKGMSKKFGVRII